MNNREETIWDRILRRLVIVFMGPDNWFVTEGGHGCLERWEMVFRHSWKKLLQRGVGQKLYVNKGKYDKVAHATRLLSLWRQLCDIFRKYIL